MGLARIGPVDDGAALEPDGSRPGVFHVHLPASNHGHVADRPGVQCLHVAVGIFHLPEQVDHHVGEVRAAVHDHAAAVGDFEAAPYHGGIGVVEGTVGDVSHMHGVHVADHLLVIDGPLAGTRAYVSSHLFGRGHNFTVRLSGIDDLFGRPDRDADRFLDEDVHPAFYEGDAHAVMEPVRQADVRRFRNVRFDQGFRVGEDRGLLALEGGDFTGAFFGRVTTHVAARGYLELPAPACEEIPVASQMRPRYAATTDQCKLDAVTHCCSPCFV